MSPRQVTQAQSTDAHSNELFDLVSQLVKHATNLPVNALTQDNPHPRHSNCLHLVHACALSIEHHPGQQFWGECGVPGTIERHFVFLFYFVARMRQALRQIAVVGENEESFGLGIEPADIEEARELGRQEIEDGVVRVGIGARRNETGRFVKDNIKPAFTANQLVPDFDVIALRRLRAEIGADTPVDCDAAIGDELVAMPPRTNPGGGEETV